MTLGNIMIDLAGVTLSDSERDLLLHSQIGGVILFTRNFASIEQITELIGTIHALREPKLLVAIDHEGGRVQRFREGFTCLPSAQKIGALYDQDLKRAQSLAETTGWLMAAELRTVGIDFSFAPVLDLDHGVSSVIGDRAFHRSPEVVADLAHHVMKGMRRVGMQAVGKHFPGHGAVKEDSHDELPFDRRRIVDILTEDMLPFERLIRYGLAGIMPAHVVYAESGPQLAGYSPYWLGTVLRNQLGFQGAIFSDDLSMAAACVAGDCGQRARAALKAGCDMVLICNQPEGVRDAIKALDGYENLTSQVRLTRFHGHKGMGYEELQVSEAWQKAVQAIKPLLDDSHSIELSV